MDEQAKKKALRMIPYGLYVVGVKDGNAVHAFTGSWFSQASFKPPLVMLGVSADGRSAQMIKKERVFSVNFLGEDQQHVAQTFFKCPGPANGRFGPVAYAVGSNGCPLLTESPAFLECRVADIVEKGDHLVVIGEVTEAVVRKEAPPLVLSKTPWKYGG